MRFSYFIKIYTSITPPPLEDEVWNLSGRPRALTSQSIINVSSSVAAGLEDHEKTLQLMASAIMSAIRLGAVVMPG